MLTALRGSTGGIITKAFLVVLAGSFAVWGVADVFTGSRDEVLAKVGDRDIGSLEFRRFLERRLQTLARRTGQNLTVQQARSLGIDRQILGDMLRGEALNQQAKKLNMSLSDKFVADQIANNPAFKGPTGVFSPQALRYQLQQNGLSEQQFVANERSNLLRTTIASSVSDGFSAPKTYVEVADRQLSEKRDITYITVTGKGITVPEPSEKQAKDFYEKNKGRFAVPERRIFEILYTDAQTLGKDVKISEDRLKALYEKQKARFGTPETRSVEQIPFASMQEAQTALKRIREGIGFDVVATEKGLKEKDRLLGSFSRDRAPDDAIGDAAFKLKEGEVSEPVKGKLSTFLIRVTKIVPENIKTFNEVRKELIKSAQKEAGRDIILDLRDKVEDERGGGTEFKKIAESLSLTFITTPAVNRQGNDEKGQPVENIPDWPQVIKAGYESDVGLEVDPIATKNDGYVWVNVKEIIPRHTQPFKQARDKANKLWKASELRKQIEKKAEEIQKRLNGGEKFADIAAQISSEIKKEQGISRSRTTTTLSGSAVREVFSHAPGKYSISLDSDGKSAKILNSTPVLAPPFNASTKQAKAISKQLTVSLNNDLFGAYMSELQKSVGTQIIPEGWAHVFQAQNQR